MYLETVCQWRSCQDADALSAQQLRKQAAYDRWVSAALVDLAVCFLTVLLQASHLDGDLN